MFKAMFAFIFCFFLGYISYPYLNSENTLIQKVANENQTILQENNTSNDLIKVSSVVNNDTKSIDVKTISQPPLSNENDDSLASNIANLENEKPDNIVLIPEFYQFLVEEAPVADEFHQQLNEIVDDDGYVLEQALKDFINAHDESEQVIIDFLRCKRLFCEIYGINIGQSTSWSRISDDLFYNSPWKFENFNTQLRKKDAQLVFVTMINFKSAL